MSNKEPSLLLRISKITIGILLAILGVLRRILLAILALIVIVLHICYPKIQKELEFTMAVTGGAAVVYAAYYAAKAFHQNAIQQKLHRSFQAITPLNNIDQASIRILVEKEIKPKNISPEQLYEKITSDHNLLTAVTTLLGLFEDISIGIQKGYYDEETLFLSISFIVPWYFEGLRPYIDEERKNYCSDLFSEGEKLSIAWKANKSMVTGKKFESLR